MSLIYKHNEFADKYVHESKTAFIADCQSSDESISTCNFRTYSRERKSMKYFLQSTSKILVLGEKYFHLYLDFRKKRFYLYLSTKTCTLYLYLQYERMCFFCIERML
jgi:hypothetical protein